MGILSLLFCSGRGRFRLFIIFKRMHVWVIVRYLLYGRWFQKCVVNNEESMTLHIKCIYYTDFI
jgi:hypothetical protein